MVGFIDLSDVDIDRITFPSSKKFDVFPGDAVVRCCDCCTFPNGVTRKSSSWDASLEA